MCFPMMREVPRLLTPVLVILVVFLITPVDVQAHEYNLLGYEGVGTLGATDFVSGPPPLVGDYVTTHCRYIDVPNALFGHYYLRYHLDLPDNAIITGVKLYVANFDASGALLANLRSRPWNSRQEGTTVGAVVTDWAATQDTQIDMGSLSVTVNNQTTEYWIEVTPQNSGNPGELCVYGIQVTYN